MDSPELWAWIFALSGILFLILYLIKDRKFGYILLTAYLVRLSLATIHRYFYAFPAGQADVIRFEELAYQWSQIQGTIFWDLFEPTTSTTLSWFGAIVYKIFGRSPFLLEVIIVMGGTLCVYYSIKIAFQLTDISLTQKIGWFVALFPSAVQFSVVYLREVPIILFSLIGVYYLIKWSKSGNELYFFLGVLGFVGSTFFHGAYAIAVITTFFILLWAHKYGKVEKYSPSWLLSVLFVFVVLVSVSATGGFFVAKIGDISVLFETEKLADITSSNLSSAARGTASYLQFLALSNPFDFIWQSPIRVFYFLFTPLPWQLSSVGHLIGVIDSLFYYVMIFQLVKFRNQIFQEKQLLLIFTIAVIMIVVFSFGTSNFGTAIRHRAKFAPFLIVLSCIVYRRGKMEYAKNY